MYVSIYMYTYIYICVYIYIYMSTYILQKQPPLAASAVSHVPSTNFSGSGFRVLDVFQTQ